MPAFERWKLELTAEGLVGEHEGKRVPFGIMDDGSPVLLFPWWEDESSDCVHCGGRFCVDDSTDSDHRCGRCQRSHKECERCDRCDAEQCIECEGYFCEGCRPGHLDFDETAPCHGGRPTQGEGSTE